jgi:transposase
MLSFSGSLRVFVALAPCDMRKSYDSLYALVVSQLGEDPKSGAVFVFANRARNRIKLLHFDGSGLWVHAKRLESGTFSWPKPSTGGDAAKLKLAPEALALLTDGIDLRGAKMRAWYERE